MKKKILFFFALIVVCLILFLVFLYVEKDREYQINEELKGKVTKNIVEKNKRQISLYQNNTLLQSYNIALGKNPIGQKEFEGIYTIDSKNPKSGYYLNLGISYPNTQDKQYAEKQGKNAGGEIKIHGLPNGMSVFEPLFRIYGDWTNGCIALDNASVKKLYEIVPIGTPIHIYP